MTDLLNSAQFGTFPKAGLRGRNAPVVKFPLKWAHEYVKEGISLTPTFPIDVTGGITDFGMMGNDTYGNCAFCGKFHLDMTTAKAAGTTGPSPDSMQAVTEYNLYDGDQPAPGPGADLASLLRWFFVREEIKAFCPVDLSNPSLVFGLMAAGFGLYIGVNLTDNNNDQFNSGQPFDLNGQQPDPQDGHCVVLSKAQSASGPFEVITWGRSWPCTYAWLEACLLTNPNGEAFLVVTTEEQLALFEPTLVADCRAIGGGEESPAPQPAPAPPPVPNLPAPLPAFYEDWWNALQKRERELEEWIKAHL